MNLSFKNRIAFYYMIATAIIMAIAFFSIFFIVKNTVLNNLDNDLSYEAEKHTKEIKFFEDKIMFINKAEWEEREHKEIQVNPVFIQLMNKDGKLMDKSPNLKQDQLPFKKSENEGHFDTKLKNKTIRQVQIPVIQNGETRGYIIAAMSSESELTVIKKLRNVLLISYFTLLLGFYFSSRFLAGRSIIPIQQINKTITKITQNNLNQRVTLPQNKDEIYSLSSNFNDLLERIEKALEREKQFTSDASHELRTPLASLRGTLEVLVRKPREQKEYEEKIHFSLNEIERMTAIIEQLLLLARIDKSTTVQNEEQIDLPQLVNESLQYFKDDIEDKNLKIKLEFEETDHVKVPRYYSSIIINNLLSNAIKYSNKNGIIKIGLGYNDNRLVFYIKDDGIGIKKEDLKHIYNSFFRSDALQHKDISGNGLGLSIVKKCADTIQAEIIINSEIGKGTTVTVFFK